MQESAHSCFNHNINLPATLGGLDTVFVGKIGDREEEGGRGGGGAKESDFKSLPIMTPYIGSRGASLPFVATPSYEDSASRSKLNGEDQRGGGRERFQRVSSLPAAEGGGRGGGLGGEEKERARGASEANRGRNLARLEKTELMLQRCSLMSRYCIILQYTAIHCDTMRYTAIHCNTLQYTAIHYYTLYHCRHCNTPQTYCNTLQYTAAHYTTLQCTATQRNALQHTAVHC